jgi:hypothetical protein
MVEKLIPENDLENLLVEAQEKWLNFAEFIKFFEC